MKKLNFKKIQTCGVLLATAIVLSSCQKEEEKIYVDNPLASQTPIEELFSNPSEDALNVSVDEKEEMLQQKALLEEKLLENPSDHILAMDNLRVINNKVNGESGYSIGVVKESTAVDKSFVFTLGEEDSVYLYRDGHTYNTDYIMKLDEVVYPCDFRLYFNSLEIESLLSRMQDAKYLAPCTSYSKDRQLTDTEHIAANGVFVCNQLSYLSPFLDASTRPKLYIRLDNHSTTTLDCYGLHSNRIEEEGQKDYISCASYPDGNAYKYFNDSYEGVFLEYPFVPINNWLRENGFEDCAKDMYSVEELQTLENAIQASLINPYIITTEEALLANPALNVTAVEKEEMLARKVVFSRNLQEYKGYTDKNVVYVINNEINGESGYSIGILENSHISDKGLVVTYGEEDNVYVYRDGDQYNSEYIVKLVDVLQPEDAINYYTDVELRRMIERINTYPEPIVSCATWSNDKELTDDQNIAASGIYICDTFDELYSSEPINIPTAPRVYIRIQDDFIEYYYCGLENWNISGKYRHDDYFFIGTLTNDRNYWYYYENDMGDEYQGRFPENPLVPINEWLLANGYDAYVQDTYSVEDLKAIDNAIKDVMSYSKHYSE